MRVDFLVNSRLVIEVDGKEFHNNENSFKNDRLRDQKLILEGFLPVRFPASQIYKSPSAAAKMIIEIASKHDSPDNSELAAHSWVVVDKRTGKRTIYN